MEFIALLERLKRATGATEADMAYHLGFSGRSYLARVFAREAPVTESLMVGIRDLLRIDDATLFLCGMLPPSCLNDISTTLRLADIRTATIGEVVSRAVREVSFTGPQGAFFAGFQGQPPRPPRVYRDLRRRHAQTIRFMASALPRRGTMAGLAKTLNITPSLIKYIAKAQRPITQKTARRIADRLSVDRESLDFIVPPSGIRPPVDIEIGQVSARVREIITARLRQAYDVAGSSLCDAQAGPVAEKNEPR